MNTVTKSLVGAGALVLGVDGGVESDASEQETADLQAERGLVFAYDFRPRVPFEVVGRFSQPTTNSVVSRSPNLTGYDEYTGYLVLYVPDTPGKYGIVFTKGTALRTGTTYRFETDVQVFDTELSLLAARLRSVRAAEETATDTTTEGRATTTETTTEGAEETTTTTPAETTTEANETTTIAVDVPEE